MRNFQQFFGMGPIEYRTRPRVIIEQLAECLTASDMASRVPSGLTKPIALPELDHEAAGGHCPGLRDAARNFA